MAVKNKKRAASQTNSVARPSRKPSKAHVTAPVSRTRSKTQAKSKGASTRTVRRSTKERKQNQPDAQAISDKKGGSSKATNRGTRKPSRNAVIGYVIQEGKKVEAVSREIKNGERQYTSMNQKWGKSPPACQAGRAAEIHHATTYNAAAAGKGLGTRAKITSEGGAPHAASDIDLRDAHGRLRGQVQCKYHGRAEKTAAAVSKPKYRGMSKLVPAEQADSVKRTASRRAGRTSKGLEYADTEKHAKSRIECDGAKSKPLSHQEAQRLPAHGVKRLRTDRVVAELKFFGKASMVGGVLAGGIEVVQNRKSILKRGERGKQARKGVAKAAGKGALQSGACAAGARGISRALGRAAPRFVRGSGPIAIAATGVEIGADLVRLKRGQLTGGQVKRRAVQHVARGSAAWLGAFIGGRVGGAVFGLPGVVIGGLLGGVFGGLLSDSRFAA